MPNNRHKTPTRRTVLKSLGASAAVVGGVPVAGAAQTSSTAAERRKEYKDGLKILDKGGDLSEFVEYLEENNFSVAREHAQIENAAPAAKENSSVSQSSNSSGGQEASNNQLSNTSSTADVSPSGYQDHENVDLNILLNYDLDTSRYFAQATWQWSGQTLDPLDAVAITYKEDSWYVPADGYDSSAYVTQDGDARSANGYGWTYDDQEDNLDGSSSQRWSLLELKPFDDSLSEEERQVWMAYTQTSSPYGSAASFEGLSLAFGALSINFSNCLDCTQDTWIEDNNGNELKLSQADAGNLE